MTTTNAPSVIASPTSPAPASRTWWKRRWLRFAVAAAVAGAMAITDLPSSSSHASDVTGAQSVIEEVASDAAPCSYGVHEALGLYADVQGSTLSAADRAEVPVLVGDDYAACSFTNSDIDDLAGIDEPNSALGKGLNDLVNETLSWCSTDAMTVIGYVSQLIEHPGDAADQKGLARSERQLDSQRLQVQRSLGALNRLLGTTSLAQVTLAKV